MGLETILSKDEKKWWKATIQAFRKKHVKNDDFYIQRRLKDGSLSKEQIRANVESLLVDARELIYRDYSVDEAELNRSLMTHLFTLREGPLKLLDDILEELKLADRDWGTGTYDARKMQIAELAGNYAGGLFAYIYELSLSNTQSRRSRAGKTFETLLEAGLDVFGVPFDSQGKLGKANFQKGGLGKKVDLVVPSIEGYIHSRTKCAIVTAKTTLRERWQEVVEELQRSGVPHIYLATLDDSIALDKVATVRQHNITLVVKKSVWEAKFKDEGSVEHFQHFYSKTLPHLLEVWPDYAKEKI